MTETLRPCPFCGGEAELITLGSEEPSNEGGDVIVCKGCQASSHVEFGYKESLVSSWNARTEQPTLADAYAYLTREIYTPAGDALIDELLAVLSRDKGRWTVARRWDLQDAVATALRKMELIARVDHSDNTKG